MALAGYQASLKVSGVAVPVTNEACAFVSGSNPNKLYRVTNTARRIWDPTAAITVKDGGVTVSAALYTFDYLFGFIQFAGYTQTGAITVDGSYLPVASVAEVSSFKFSGSANLADVTSFDSAGYRAKLATLKEGSGDFMAYSSPLSDIDPVTGGVQTLYSVLTGGTPKLLEVNFGAGASILRAWVMLKELGVDVAIDGVVESTWSYETAPQRAGASVAFGT